MTKLKAVVRVEMRDSVIEHIKKSRRHDYARGGFKVEEVIYRVKTSIPYALLECGHWRREYGHGAVISKAKRLSCFECDTAEFLLARKVKS